MRGAGRTLSRDGTPHDKEAFIGTMAMNAIGTFNVTRLAAAATQPAATSAPSPLPLLPRYSPWPPPLRSPPPPIITGMRDSGAGLLKASTT